MKKTITLLLTIIFSQAVSGQENNVPDSVKISDLRNEIGFNIAGITNHPHYINHDINYGVNYNLFNGIMYKRHFGKNAIRIGFDFYHYHYQYDYYININNPLQSTYYLVEGKYNLGKIRLGYERALLSSREQPFFAIDLSASYGMVKNTSTGYNFSPSYTEEDISITEIGIEPAIGVKYQIIRRLSLTIEINASLYYAWTGGDAGHHSGLMFAFNPVRLFSCDFHF